MKNSTLCKGCWEQMHVPIVIRGPFSIPFKAFGIRKSQMNPNLCTICENQFASVKKKKQIEISTSILFADLRGYTKLSENLASVKINELLHFFYDNCSEAIWQNEGIVNKFIGDAVLAIFNFPLERESHVSNAIRSAIDIQNRCLELKKQIDLDGDDSIGIGIGIHTGICSIGEVGRAYKDFTAIGPVVNLAARLESAAESGEILITQEVYDHVKDEFPDAEKKNLQLKGIKEDVIAFTINSSNSKALHFASS